MNTQKIDIDLEPIFNDRREGDRRQEDAQKGYVLVDRRNGNRRSSGFNAQDWWLKRNYLDSKGKSL